MYAREILRNLNENMTKADILAEVQRAAADLVIMDAHQVAEILGAAYNTVRWWASQKEIGIKLHARQRVFFPSDLEILALLAGRPPDGKAGIAAKLPEMKAMRSGGATLAQIAQAFECSEGYVSRLLKKGVD